MIITKLNAKTQSYSIGGGFGGLSQSDIAAACKGLSQLQEALIFFYVCGQNGYRAYLVDMVELELRRVESGLVEVLAVILVDDLYNSACKSCNGTGLNRHAKPCGDCGGSGRSTFPAKQLARFAKVPETSFRRKYLTKYQDVYARFEKMAMFSVDQVRQKLG